MGLSGFVEYFKMSLLLYFKGLLYLQRLMFQKLKGSIERPGGSRREGQEGLDVACGAAISAYRWLETNEWDA